jgi:hypothetical protein
MCLFDCIKHDLKKKKVAPMTTAVYTMYAMEEV